MLDNRLLIIGFTAVFAGACGPSSSENSGKEDDDEAESTSGMGSLSAGTTLQPTTTTTGDNGPQSTGDDGDTGPMGEDDGGFINPGDGGLAGQCDPGTQDCPEGQKCTSYVSTVGGSTVDATKCVEIMGDKQFGEQCTRIEGNDDCAPGYFCMTDVSGNTGEGICFEYCSVDEGVCDNGGECFGFNDGALPLCEVLCDPLASLCPADQGCYRAFDNFVCARPGYPEDGGEDGDPCFTIQGCRDGLVCEAGTADCSGEACCSPVCEVSVGEGQCTHPSEQCLAALENPTPALIDVGVCAVPQ
jgi:hypothetical protein